MTLIRSALLVLSFGASTIALAGEIGAWSVLQRENADTGELETLLVQPSAASIPDENRKGAVHPELQFACEHGTVLVRIDWQRFISSFNTELGFKVDDGRNRWRKWKVDPTNRVTLSPGVDDSREVIDLLGGGDSLTVEVSPYSEAPVTVQFDLANLDAALDELRARCPQ